MKLDAAKNEEVILAAGYILKFIAQQPHHNRPGFSNRFNNHNFRCDKIHFQQKLTRSMNPKGADGLTLTCISCGSHRYLLPGCPDSWETMQANVVEIDNSDEEEVVSFTGNLKNEICQLGHEGINCTVLDSACSSTVCGKNWLSMYFASLDSDLPNNIKKEDGSRMFKFGGGECLKAIAQYGIPAYLSEKIVIIRTDVVPSDIRLLLSLNAMKKAKIKLDLEQDCATIFGKNVVLHHTSSGHYCVQLIKDCINVDEVCVVNKTTTPESTCKKLY